jgi:hypothetical protein
MIVDNGVGWRVLCYSLLDQRAKSGVCAEQVGKGVDLDLIHDLRSFTGHERDIRVTRLQHICCTTEGEVRPFEAVVRLRSSYVRC